MKKFLVLLLVLGLATAAQAGFTYTVNGDPQPAEITIHPSDIINIGLVLDAGSTTTGLTLDYKLLENRAIINTASIQWGATFDFGPSAAVITPQWVQVSAAQMFSPAKSGLLAIMSGLQIHCEALGDVLLQIIVSGATDMNGQQLAPVGTVVHSLLIHQTPIPEPMTLMLLGLGSLFLARRKK